MKTRKIRYLMLLAATAGSVYAQGDPWTSSAQNLKTAFTGPITVQANDPNELIYKLQARQKVMALSRPSLTGSAA